MSLHKELTDFTIGSLTLRTPVTVQPGMPLSAAVRPVPECQLNFSFPETPWTMRVHTTLPRRSWPVCFGITPRPAKMEFAKRFAIRAIRVKLCQRASCITIRGPASMPAGRAEAWCRYEACSPESTP